MALTMYGFPHSRTIRVLRAADQFGLACEHIPPAAEATRRRFAV